MISKKQLVKLKKLTNHCNKCFESLETNSLRFLLGNEQYLCKNCLNERKPIFKKFKIDNVNCYVIYEYDDVYRSSLYALKGCGDIELAKTLLNPYEKEISLYFSGYIMVPAPSYIDDDMARGFNHVEVIFKILKLEMIKIFHKKERIKQSDLNSEQRKEIENNLYIESSVNINGKKILIVDDVLTTGSTVKAMIKLLLPFKPKNIKVLVGARTLTNKKDK